MPGKAAEGTALRAVASSQSPSEIHMVVAPPGGRARIAGSASSGAEAAGARGIAPTALGQRSGQVACRASRMDHYPVPV